MSLLNFHRALIVAGIVFCFGFAAMESLSISRPEGSLVVAGLFASFGVGLLVYLFSMRRILGYEVRGDRSRHG